jgi:hypothetical protein
LVLQQFADREVDKVSRTESASALRPKGMSDAQSQHAQAFGVDALMLAGVGLC